MIQKMIDLRSVTRGVLRIFSAVDYLSYGFIDVIEVFVLV